jgi:predicted transcriptional regulator
MEEALEEIEFLALSANRVAVLRALADRPHTRTDLAASTDASQPTLGRILGDFEERRWVARTGEGYAATATGRLVAEGVGELLARIETDRRLRPVLEWLPTAAMDFDLGRLREATITVPSRTRPSAPLQRELELIGESASVRICSHALNERSLATIRERVLDSPEIVGFEGVLSRAAIDGLTADAGLRSALRELLGAPNATICVHDGEIPVAVTITDERTHLLLRDDDGVLRAAIDTDDADVRSWAERTHEHYRATATPLDADEL